MLDATSQLSVSYLVIYSIVALLTLYNLSVHGKYGILGWAYLLAFCILRMAGAGLQLTNPSSATAEVLIGIGISPLVLAVLGILHESNLYISGPRPWPLRNTVYILLHVVVGGAIGLLAAGRKSLSGSPSGTSRVGAVLFLVVWVILVGLCLLSYRYPRTNYQAKLLLWGVSLSLVFLCVRIGYTVAGTFDNAANPYTGPIGYRVGLGALMEYFATVELTIFGLITHRIKDKKGGGSETGIPLSVQRPSQTQGEK